MVSKISQKVLFSKIERYLLSNQATPFVISDKSKNTMTDDFEVTKNMWFPQLTSLPSNYNKLAVGVFKDKRIAKLVLQDDSELDEDYGGSTHI